CLDHAGLGDAHALCSILQCVDEIFWITPVIEPQASALQRSFSYAFLREERVKARGSDPADRLERREDREQRLSLWFRQCNAGKHRNPASLVKLPCGVNIHPIQSGNCT